MHKPEFQIGNSGLALPWALLRASVCSCKNGHFSCFLLRQWDCDFCHMRLIPQKVCCKWSQRLCKVLTRTAMNRKDLSLVLKW